MANYLGRREKGVKKIREKGDENLGDMGPFCNIKNALFLLKSSSVPYGLKI